MSRDQLIDSLCHKQWSANGQGPDEWSCHHLFAYVQHMLHHIDIDLSMVILPDNPKLRHLAHQLSSHEELGRWTEIPVNEVGIVQARDGAAVLMARNDVPIHIGTWFVPERKVLHSDQLCGVVFDSLSTLAM